LSGLGTVGRCRDAFIAGASDFLEKPVDRLVLARTFAFCSSRQAGGVDVASREFSVGADEYHGTQHVRAALSIMQRRCSELTLDREAIAEEVRVSPDYLGRLFAKHMGRTVMDHLHEIRVAQAERLLVTTVRSVYEIARDCGYHTTGELDLHFKRARSCSPTTFRNQRRGA
jgi:transcriptional regulator GlxA family with amidase domain